MHTRDVRPWWWWINPWLYIKRRDIAYDTALETLRELSRDARLPARKERTFSKPGVEYVLYGVAARCDDCGRKFIIGLVERDMGDLL